jgi:isopentenyl diphosphate isomerase/L-lactate dehydrogenase-like FMN-dependent dehydrogenase
MTTMPAIRQPLTQIPREVCCAQDYEWLAPHFIGEPALAYVAGGCGPELTLAANRLAFEQTAILPRLLADVSGGHTRLELFGRRLPHPVLLAPVAYQTLLHPGGEVETARGAAATDSALVVSTLAGRTLEDIAAQAGDERWFQLYFQPRRADTADLVHRAEAAGYKVLMVTLDTAIKTPSLRAQRAGFVMPPPVVAASLADYPVPPQRVLERGQSLVFQGAMAEAPTWDDLAWLLAQTRLPVVVKGVLRPADAQRLQAMGVAGLVVSNHGGRALDGVPASLCVLPAIRAAVGAGYPLLLDSGIRSGSDVFKALALGADAVLVGRLQIYALAVAGALGVAHLLKLLRGELEVCMAQAGCATLADIGPDMIHHPEATAC